MLNTDEHTKAFNWHSKNWYGKAAALGQNIIDNLTIGFYDSNGTTCGEFKI